MRRNSSGFARLLMRLLLDKFSVGEPFEELPHKNAGGS
jgi:hypothetical protein